LSDTESIQLRRRALRLRHFAVAIEATSAMSLERHADTDTWRGSRALLCVNVLRRDQARLHHEADRLRSQAMLFDRRAAELDRLSAMQAGRAS
jgi:hypothetical protein